MSEADLIRVLDLVGESGTAYRIEYNPTSDTYWVGWNNFPGSVPFWVWFTLGEFFDRRLSPKKHELALLFVRAIQALQSQGVNGGK